VSDDDAKMHRAKKFKVLHDLFEQVPKHSRALKFKKIVSYSEEQPSPPAM
jgi:hypothetical protein